MFGPTGAGLVLEALTGARLTPEQHAAAAAAAARAAATAPSRRPNAPPPPPPPPQPPPAPQHVAATAAGGQWGASFVANAQSRDPCAVCLELIGAGEQCRALPCFHVFHDACVARWARRCCPTCRYAA